MAARPLQYSIKLIKYELLNSPSRTTKDRGVICSPILKRKVGWWSSCVIFNLCHILVSMAIYKFSSQLLDWGEYFWVGMLFFLNKFKKTKEYRNMTSVNTSKEVCFFLNNRVGTTQSRTSLSSANWSLLPAGMPSRFFTLDSGFCWYWWCCFAVVYEGNFG